MVSKVFVLGRTGSGKSTTVRFLTQEVQRYGWVVQSFNDYPILLDMFLEDQARGQGRFRPAERNSFEVLDLTVYKQAFHRLNWAIQHFRPATEKTLITVEFTSNQYPQALQSFDGEFLRDSHFLFISADLKTCLDRTSSRALHPQCEDDYYVIDKVLLSHYPTPYMPLYVGRKRVTFIPNMGSLGDLETKLKNLAPMLLERESDSLVSTLQRKPIYSLLDELVTSTVRQ
jgi:deoxyadenosine/deoxycytidine kinase